MRSHRATIAGLTVVALGFLVGLGSVAAGERAQPSQGAYRDVSPTELKGMLDHKDFLFVNVHIPYEGELARTDAFIPFDKVEQQLHRLPPRKDAKIVLYCMSGRMSEIAAGTLSRRGYTSLWNLDGGMIAWEKAGFPLKNFRARR